MVNRFWKRSVKRQSLWSHALLPGIRIKRWILLLLVGVTITGLGLAVTILETYRGGRLPPIIYAVSLDFLPDWLRGALLIGAGFLIIGVAVWQLNRTIVLALLPGQSAPRNIDMVSEVLRRQRRRQGPSIVVVGGGTGMPQLLRGLRGYTDNITAIVTVADDGGSSGRLRRQMGMLPPGDFRNNIAALSEAEELMTRVFQYRFAEREVSSGRSGKRKQADVEADPIGQEGGELAGHSFGNLFITTMTAVTGSFESGLAEISRVLAVRGRVLPSTLEQVTLCAELRRTREDGREEWLVVEGESKITTTTGQVMRVFLKPETPRAYPQVIQAILQADLIVASPGSFFTSVLPNLLVPAIRDAICATDAPRIYVCNVATQTGETDDYSVSDHMAQLRQHAGDAFGAVLANDNYDPQHPPSGNAQWVQLPKEDETIDYTLFTGNLVDNLHPWRHDSQKVAARLIEVYEALRAGRSAAPENSRSG